MLKFKMETVGVFPFVKLFYITKFILPVYININLTQEYHIIPFQLLEVDTLNINSIFILGWSCGWPHVNTATQVLHTNSN